MRNEVEISLALSQSGPFATTTYVEELPASPNVPALLFKCKDERGNRVTFGIELGTLYGIFNRLHMETMKP